MNAHIALGAETFCPYAIKHGFWLFPVSSTEKKPLVKWKSQSSADPAQWAAWQVDFPGCGFGINAEKSNVFLLDTDVKHIGEGEAFTELVRLFHSWGIDPPFPHCRSQSGGLHHYFRRPEGCPPPETMQGLPKLRVDANGREIIGVRNRGYCVAPGSAFDGRPYTLLTDAPPHPCPPQLIAALQFPVTENREVSTSQGTIYPSQLRRMLAEADQLGAFDGYDEWYQGGMALRLACGDAGFDVWLELTRHCDGDPWIKWCSFDLELVPGKRQVRLTRIKEICARVGVTRPLDQPTVDEMFADALAGMSAGVPAVAAGVPGKALVPAVSQGPQGLQETAGCHKIHALDGYRGAPRFRARLARA